MRNIVINLFRRMFERRIREKVRTKREPLGKEEDKDNLMFEKK